MLNLLSFIMKQYFIRFSLFLLINFIGLALGGWFTGQGTQSDWYWDLHKAPWTPPGWVFGFAWTLIMILLANYMTWLYHIIKRRRNLLVIFGIQWVLNFLWNPVFFYYHYPVLGLIIITSLLFIVIRLGQFALQKKEFKAYLLIIPYILWLCIATSLNAYIVIYN